MSLTRDLYRAARLSNDMGALLSGDPHRIARRARNKIVGRAIGRAGGWRALWGSSYVPVPPTRPRRRQAAGGRRRARTGGWRTLWAPRP